MDVPALPAGAGHVWWASPAAARPGLIGLLDDAERARWARFVQAADRARYLVAHALLRVVLAAHLAVPPDRVELTAVCARCGGPHGKPRLRDPAAGLDVSISHSGERVAVAVARVPVGVDVERIRPERTDASVARLALSAAEQGVLWRLPAPERPAALLRYWTRKEALLKATGDGLAVAPSSVTVTPPDQAPAVIAWAALPGAGVQLADLHPGPGHVACLAALGASLTVAEHHADDLLHQPIETLR